MHRPVDPITQVPIAPARDFMVASYAGILPSLIIPGVLGVVFGIFANRAEAYFWFFIISAAIHSVSAFLYLVVHEKQQEAREAAANPIPTVGADGATLPAAKVLGAAVPAGAKLCDRMLFGAEVYEEAQRHDQPGGSGLSQRRGYTRELAKQRVDDYRRLDASRERELGQIKAGAPYADHYER